MDLTALAALDPTTLRCPYESYEAARQRGVFFDEALGAFVVSRHADAVAVLRDAATFSSSEVLGRPLPPPDAGSDQILPLLLTSDDPEHAAKRGLVARAFTPRRLRHFEPAVADLCARLADAMLAREEIDFVRDFAAPLPIRVITTVLGVPKGDAALFRQWSEEVTASLGGHEVEPERRRRAGAAFRELLEELLDDRDQLDPESVLSVIAEEEAGGGLSRFESVRLVMELIVAGNITTTDHLANSMVLLADRPDLVEQLHADRSLVATFVEESLRLEGPVQGFYRISVSPASIGGTEVPAGSRVLVLYGSANRDETRFEAPATLRLDRSSPTGHLAFGFGAHTCLGAPLARIEARLALEALLDRATTFEVDPDGVEYLASYINHGPSRLPMRFGRAPVGASR